MLSPWIACAGRVTNHTHTNPDGSTIKIRAIRGITARKNGPMFMGHGDTFDAAKRDLAAKLKEVRREDS